MCTCVYKINDIAYVFIHYILTFHFIFNTFIIKSFTDKYVYNEIGTSKYCTNIKLFHTHILIMKVDVIMVFLFPFLLKFWSIFFKITTKYRRHARQHLCMCDPVNFDSTYLKYIFMIYDCEVVYKICSTNPNKIIYEQ